MADSIDYSSSSTEFEQEVSMPMESDGPPAHSTRKRLSKSPQKSPKKARKQQVRLPDSLRSLVPLQNHVINKLKGHDIDTNLSLRTVAAALELQKNYLQAKQRTAIVHRNRVPKPAVREKICAQFHVAPNTYSSIMAKCLSNRSVYNTGANGGRGS